MISEGHDIGKPAPVVYVSGEEDILEKTEALLARALIIDSIQTMYLRGVMGNARGLSQSSSSFRSKVEKSSSHRLLQPVKNRFGSTDEVLVKQADLDLRNKVSSMEKRVKTLARLG
ncbi:hypothetical protein CRG98_008571 [Punica granatum]|uniref:Uncharacterized protein n=1 Tax=Punica granatum TaxID=22663 RepID=A0A2I0KRP4_PUNGR|nr:hypothetical protein CRG98_008571 [Punica granatum]